MKAKLINFSKLILSMLFVIILGLSQIGGCGGGGGGGGDDANGDANGGDSINYAGTWSGTTDQGRAISFNVEEVDYYAVTRITYSVHVSGGICEADINGAISNIQASVDNNEAIFSGTGSFSIDFYIYFDSETECHGTWTAIDTTYDANNSGTFTASKGVTGCTDADSDGYYAEGGCGTVTDCEPADPSINPGAVEICNDGVDNDCDSGVDEDCSFYTLDVCPAGCTYSTIQSGIDNASPGDTVLVNDGIYTENIDFNGLAIIVKSVNGPASTTIDGNASGSVVSFTSCEGVDSVLDGFTITNGSGTPVVNDWPTPDFLYYGGGIYCGTSSPTIKNCIITNNTGSDEGGGIYVVNGSPTIEKCGITSNTATMGGGISVEGGSPTIINCSIVGNSTSWVGGAIYSQFFTLLTITNCTISDNGDEALVFRHDGMATVQNSILWGTSQYVAWVANDAAVTVSYSDIQGGCPDGFNIEEGGQVSCGGGNINDDPLFVGGGDYHLTAGSPCIDAGTSTGAPSDDIDGDTRPQGAGYDMGSDEY